MTLYSTSYPKKQNINIHNLIYCENEIWTSNFWGFYQVVLSSVQSSWNFTCTQRETCINKSIPKQYQDKTTCYQKLREEIGHLNSSKHNILRPGTLASWYVCGRWFVWLCVRWGQLLSLSKCKAHYAIYSANCHTLSRAIT